MRDTLMRVKDERLGDLAVQGPLPKLSVTLGEVRHLGTTRGRHNEEVFRELLGIDENRFEALEGEKVV